MRQAAGVGNFERVPNQCTSRTRLPLSPSKLPTSYCCPCGLVVNCATLLVAEVPLPCPAPESIVKK